METQPEYREAGNASRSAALAAVMGKPQLALGLLLWAQALELRNPAHLVNLAGIANYYGLYAEALALVTVAERLNPSAALPVFQSADAALRNLYTVAWRSSATIATRFSEPTYRANAILRLRGLYYAASQKVYENAQQYLSGLELARGSEDCGGGSTAIIGPLATPQVPAACVPTAAPPVPTRGWRLALSCDRTDFNLANPQWMDRYQILCDSFSPLVFSQLDARLAVFVPGGFVRLDAEGALMDAGLTAPGGNRNWSLVWNASNGSVGFASSEPQFGVK